MNIWRLMSLLWLMILLSCMKTEVLNAPEEEEVVVEKRKKSEKPLPPPIEADTTRVQIGFSPTVEGWDKAEVEM